jgi:hypothetical protein
MFYAVCGALGAILWFVGWLFNRELAMQAYLFAWLLTLGAALGSMSILMLHHLTGGRWGLLVRRPAEAAAMTLPLLAILFVPVALQLHHLFPWARPGDISQNAVLRHRQLLFTPTFTLIRAAIYFAAWIFFAWRLQSLSLEHDRTADPNLLDRMRRWSAFGLVVYFITMSLAAYDWIASREVDWYSSTFGWNVIIGQSVMGVALLIIIAAALSRHASMNVLAEPDLVHDLGNLLLTVVVLWAYIAFAQFLVIWMGNTQEDIIWYIHRTHGGWWWAGTALIVLHFAAPFVFLLFQRIKRDIRALAVVAGVVIVMRAVDVLWMIAPSSLGEQPGRMSWMDVVALIGIGGIWLAAFLRLLPRHPLIPLAFTAATGPLSYESRNQRQSLA